MPEARDYVQLAATSVTKVYGLRHSQRHTAVDGVSLTVESGQAVGIVGESGSGKSTLARILAGIETPSSGAVYFNDLPIRSQLSGRSDRLNLRRHVQLVAQDTSSSFDPLKTLRASVRIPAMRLLGLSRAKADAEVDLVIAGLGLPPELADRYPQQVSGGQRQLRPGQGDGGAARYGHLRRGGVRA
jgi:peptide/nickel transport system ATP-binding protein